jgi:hypothetical protein
MASLLRLCQVEMGRHVADKTLAAQFDVVGVVEQREQRSMDKAVGVR